jgi:hypothetical protein
MHSTQWRAVLNRGLALHRLFRFFYEKNTPEARGRRLLRAWLTPEQRAQFDSFGYFDVTGCTSGKKYRIHFGVSANVQELGEDGNPKICWCFVPSGSLVPGDVMLTQKIALETNEQAALGVANRFPVLPVAARSRLHRGF